MQLSNTNLSRSVSKKQHNPLMPRLHTADEGETVDFFQRMGEMFGILE